MNRATRRLSTLLTLSLLGISSTASAQSHLVSAETLFEEGKRLMDAGNYTDACPKLAESQRLEPGAGTLLNLGACYEKLGRTASAWVTYREATSVADTTQRKAWAAQATKRAQALEPSLSRLTIIVTRSDNVDVKRDGQSVRAAEWGVPVPVDPGTHVIEASAPGRKPFSTSVEVNAPGPLVINVPELEVEPPPPAPPPPPPPAPPPPKRESMSPVAIVGLGVAGVGLVGVGIGVVSGLKASHSFDRATSHCSSDYARCDSTGVTQVHNARGEALVSTLGVVVGSTLVVGGAIVFFAGRSKQPSTAVRVSPLVGALNGLSLEATFR